MSEALREAADRRRQALQDAGAQQRSQAIPCGAGRSQAFPAQLRGKMVQVGGKSFYHVEGYASAYERGYDMWDWAGPYKEIVSVGAEAETLAAGPDVVFLINHRGLSMARTIGSNGPAPSGGSLRLWGDTTGLGDEAWLNPQRPDVQMLMHAIDDEVITEQSFAFMITDGQWSPDYTEYRINAFDINRGDVSAVNYGANPYTSIAARSQEILAALDQLPVGAARAALERLNLRDDLAASQAAHRAPSPVEPSDGMRTSQVDAWLAAVAAGRA